MQIAIVGAGLSGIATAWYLLQQNLKLHVTVFDKKGIAGGASGVAAGLMHPFVGPHAKLNLHGIEGCEATFDLLDISSKALGEPVADYSGLLRLAINPKQNEDFAKSAACNGGLEWQNTKQCHTRINALAEHPGIFISNAVTVDCNRYLQGLWKACADKGAAFEIESFANLTPLSSYDAVIITLGAACKEIPELSHIPLTPIKGQILELTWPQGLPPLPCAVSSHAYIAMNQASGNRTCLVGATYERNFVNDQADIDFAISDIMPKAAAIIPALKEAAVIGCRAGIRASSPNHMPYIEQFRDNGWVLTGMGSKGLMYHGLFAKKVCNLVVNKVNNQE